MVFDNLKSFENLVEINFERKKEANKIFEKDLVPERILQELSLFSGKAIVPGKTLLFFDEVQECPEAIQSMRYFFEEIPSLHLIAAGSLLDFSGKNRTSCWSDIKLVCLSSVFHGIFNGNRRIADSRSYCKS